MKSLQSLYSIIVMGVAVLAPAVISPMHNLLDLQGTGEKTDVILPFVYLHREPNVQYDLIPEGGFAVYDIEKNNDIVVIMGPLNPCLGVAVTDGKKLILFHKHYANSLGHMVDIIGKNLDLSDPQVLLARIFTTKDDCERTRCRRGQNFYAEQLERVAYMKSALEHDCKIPREQILADLFPLCEGECLDRYYRYKSDFLGRYHCAELYIAVKLMALFGQQGQQKCIQFFSIDPWEVNFFNIPPDRLFPVLEGCWASFVMLRPFCKLSFLERWRAYGQILASCVSSFHIRALGMPLLEYKKKVIGEQVPFCAIDEQLRSTNIPK